MDSFYCMEFFSNSLCFFMRKVIKVGYMAFFMKIWEKNWPIFKIFLINQDKNQNVNEKMWENEFDFWILRIKIRLYGNFHENLRKKFLTHFLNHFSLIKAKTKMKMKKSGKMNSIFELSISKLGYMAIFMKIFVKKILTHFIGHFWLILAKMKMLKIKIKKYGKMSLIFEFSISKLVCVAIFMKTCQKKILSHFLNHSWLIGEK